MVSGHQARILCARNKLNRGEAVSRIRRLQLWEFGLPRGMFARSRLSAPVDQRPDLHPPIDQRDRNNKKITEKVVLGEVIAVVNLYRQLSRQPHFRLVPGEDGTLSPHDHHSFAPGPGEAKYEPPVEVALTGEGVVVNVGLLHVLGQQPPGWIKN